ncbi:MAG: sigma 54-interacting transcriptional regulator [Blastocatellia bacterium]
MNSQILVITGSLCGTTLELNDELTIGRSSTCQLLIKEPSVSRLHCVIERDGERFKIADHSSYGTIVNGIPIREHFLDHGDCIEVGNSLLLFINEPATLTGVRPVELDDGDIITRSCISLHKENGLYLNGNKLAASSQSPGRIIRDLQVLLQISARISSHRSLETLQSELLKSIFEAVPAERGAIILLQDGLQEFSSINLDRGERFEQPLRVSRKIVQELIQKGVALLSNDLSTFEGYLQSESLISAPIKSLIGIPLTNGERTFGLIYLVSSSNKSTFDERHLELVTAIASIASVAIENVRNLEWLKGERQRLQEELSVDHAMIGESQKMRQILHLISKVAPTDSSVLICGESGTGKELVAQALHASSERVDEPFIAINCAALTETLLESELFGHEKGAFTGAITQKKGKLEAADGGTVFLDEVGELNMSLQAKLLRVLQERTFERVGGIRPIKVNIRLIAATNRNLREAIARGAFRDDLYFRLNVIEITMPPLRERREDILLLARYFTAKFSHKCKRRIYGLSPEVGACLMSYNWPGNVRELANAIERAVVLGSEKMITLEDLPETVRGTRPPVDSNDLGFYEALRTIKKQFILNAFDKAQGKHGDAAKLLGIHPNNLRRLLRTLDLKL